MKRSSNSISNSSAISLLLEFAPDTFIPISAKSNIPQPATRNPKPFPMRATPYIMILVVVGFGLLAFFWKPVPRSVILLESEWKDTLLAVNLEKRLEELGIQADSCYLLISKANYQLDYMADSQVIKRYAVVFGDNPVDDKLCQGDRRTPEGTFHIRAAYEHPKWQKFMWIDYPTADSWRKHRQAIADGVIPAGSSIGGEIGIHGVPQGQDYAIPNRFNWTFGCISLQNKDVNELYRFVGVGTKVVIAH